jgi:hypothetical protein
MRKFSALGWCLLTAVLAFYRPGPALAQAVTGTCGVVMYQDCVTSDSTFIPTAARASVSAGVTTVQCLGTTTNFPATATTCSGERVNRTSSESAPAHPCSITLGATAQHVDDWTETVSPPVAPATLGSVKLTCSAGGTDTN